MSDMRLAIDFLGILQKKHRELFWEDKKEGLSAITIYPYLNGREKGFAMIKEESDGRQFKEYRVLVFAEHRNSDTIRLFYGLNKDFDDDQWYKNKGKKGQMYEIIPSFNRHFIPSEIVFRTQEKNYHLDNLVEIEQAIKFVRKYFK